MEAHYTQILLTKIDRDPAFEVRQAWSPERDPTLPALVQSLTGPEGQIHPIVVVARPTPTTFGRTHTLIVGARRLAAAQRAGWERILARVLPPCDLTAPHERLRLLAMAIRENTERAPLAADDRREALRRLKALYDAVYPLHGAAAARAALAQEGDAIPAFPRWAAGATQIPERTIRRDLRRLLLVTPAFLPAPGPATPVPPPPDPDEDAVQHALHLGQHASAALRRLTIHLTPSGRTRITPMHYRQLVQTLHELHATLAMALTAATVPAPRSLDAFALLLQQRVPPLTGALWGLATSPPTEWEAVPPTTVEMIHAAMATLWAGWAQVEPTVTAHAPAPCGAFPVPQHRLLGSRPTEVDA
jgi:hypothetical protein